MDDDHPHLEKNLDTSLTEMSQGWGKLPIWLVLIAIACGLVLYLAVRTNLIQ